MPTFNLEFEVYCGKCGDGLCLNSDTDETRTRRMPFVKVRPCEKCIDDAKEDAFERGKEEGIRETEEKHSEDV